MRLSDISSDCFRVTIPALLTFILFLATIFGFYLPDYEHTLIEQQRQTLHENTHIAAGILEYYHQQAESGTLSQTQAQQAALALLRRLRYGDHLNEYFWVNDFDGHMLMHPYQREFEGEDMFDFRDSTGTPLFREFIAAAGQPEGGFVHYRWNKYHDTEQLAPKLSHVRGFKPWGWIVGTGIYLDDLQSHINSLSQRLWMYSLLILAGIILLSGYLIRHGVRVVRCRVRAEAELKRHQEHLEQLVDARTLELQTANRELQTEIHDRERLENKLKQMSICDELTGLHNRRGFMHAARSRLAEARRNKERLFLLFADLDNMKQINDRLGHEYGDQALKAFARVLETSFREADVIARLGGDEFVVLLTGSPESPDCAGLRERLEERIDTSQESGHPFRLEASVGIVTISQPPTADLDHLLAEADQRMYADKQARKGLRPA